jgi:hypothetical protein
MKRDKTDVSLRWLFSIRHAASNPECSTKKFNAKLIRAAFAALLPIFLWAQPATAQTATAQTATAQEVKPFKDFKSYVTYVAKNHKAPFDRDGAVIPPAAAKSLAAKHTMAAAEGTAATAALENAASGYKNIQVNQDRNPWPKAELGAAIDPSNGTSWVVMANDFRENYDHEFYHVSTNSGRTWTDDSMVGGNDPFTGFIPLTTTGTRTSILKLTSFKVTHTGHIRLCCQPLLTISRAMDCLQAFSIALGLSINLCSPRIRIPAAPMKAQHTCITPISATPLRVPTERQRSQLSGRRFWNRIRRDRDSLSVRLRW